MRSFFMSSSRRLRRVALITVFALAATIVNAVPVQAAAATHIELVDVNTSATANRTLDQFSVQALDGNNQFDTTYDGVVSFTGVGCASDCIDIWKTSDTSQPPLPGDQYDFVVFNGVDPPDNGQRTLYLRWKENAVPGATLRATAALAGNGIDTDDADPTTIASNNPAILDLEGVQTNAATTGTPESITVTIKNAQGQTNPNPYTGAVTFSASCGDCFTITPNDGGANSKRYTFAPGDNGTKQFQLTWTTAGSDRTFIAAASDLAPPAGDDSETRSGINVQQGATTTSSSTTSSTSTTTTTVPQRTKVAHVVTGAGPGGGPHVFARRAANASQVTHSFFAYDPSFVGGVRVATGDINGDGYDDIITAPGPGGGPHIQVFSGHDRALLKSFFAYAPHFTGGVYVASADVDGDGRDDIITAPGPGGGPHVRAFDGDSPSGINVAPNELRGLMAYADNFTGGVRVAAGQFDGDNKADIVTAPGPGGGPHVRLFSGANGAELAGFMAYNANFTGGVFVAADRSNEGLVYTGVGPGGGPHVRVFDPFDAGEELLGFMAGNSVHGAIPAVGESTGAASEVLVVSRVQNDSIVRFYDLGDGTPLPGAFPAYVPAIGVFVAVGVL